MWRSAEMTLTADDFARIRMWTRGYRRLMRNGTLDREVHAAGTPESMWADGIPAFVTVDDVEALLALAEVLALATVPEPQDEPKDHAEQLRRALGQLETLYVTQVAQLRSENPNIEPGAWRDQWGNPTFAPILTAIVNGRTALVNARA